MRKYLIVVERTQTGYSAFSPDVPGCIATGKTKPETERNMREAIAFHLEGLREDHLGIPSPHTYPAYCSVPA